MPKKKTRSLRTRLLASYLLLCLVPMFLTVFLVSVNSAQRLERNALQRAALYSAQIVRGMDTFTETYSSLTRLLTIDYDVISVLNRETDSIYEQMNRNTTVRRLLMRVGMLHPDIRNVMLVTETGRVYQYSGQGVSLRADALLSAPWFEEIRSSPSDLMITPTHYTDYYETDRDGIAVSACRRIYGSDGRRSCILIVDIDPYTLVDLTASQKLEGLEEDMHITVRTGSGGLVWDSLLSDGSATWEAVLQASPAPDGNDSDFVWQEVSSDGLLHVTVRIPRRSMMRSTVDFSLYATVIMGCFVLLILLVSTRLSRHITRPVLELQEKMDEAEQGRYSLLPVPDVPDEIGVLTAHYNHMIDTIQTLISEVYLREIKQKDAMLMALRSQINPHVLFNTLEAIRMKAVVNGDMETAQMIKLLSRMFRATLDADPEKSTIRSELLYASCYMEVQNIRFRDRFRFTSRIPEDLMDIHVPPMIFQPILENSIEHGGRASHEAMEIVLDAHAEDGVLTLLFTDTGAGMSPEQMETLNRDLEDIARGQIDTFTGHERIALRNIAERICLRYGEGWGLRIEESSGAGTTVRLRIPLSPPRKDEDQSKEDL